MERFFELARQETDDFPAGWTGQITSNSFMKREFGVKLIERFLPTKDVRLVADTSGAFIPGHGTPTLILVGRASPPQTTTLRAILGVRGEPGRPVDPASGQVWSSIVDHVAEPGWNDHWITVTDLERSRLSSHPWSLSGGGAPDLLDHLEGQAQRLNDLIDGAGFGAVTGDDDVFAATDSLPRSWLRWKIPTAPFVEGDRVRDHSVNGTSTVAFPYAPRADEQAMAAALWPWRTQLVHASSGRSGTHRPWWHYYQFTLKRFEADRVVTYAEVASSNHFAVTDGGKVMKQTAPVITFSRDTRQDRVAAIAAVLNASTTSFWLKQNCHDKGIRGEGGGFTSDEWERFYQFNSTNVRQLPMPSGLPTASGLAIAQLVDEVATHGAAAVVAREAPNRVSLDLARTEYNRIRGRMVAEQEELDWEVYGLYGLLEEDYTYCGDDLPEVVLGERAFEILLARKVAAGEEQTAWFERHGTTAVKEIPSWWPMAYRDVVQRRIDLMECDRSINLLEKPEHKRRWASVPWEKQQDEALRGWLLDRLEDKLYWFDGQGRPTPRSIAQLADSVGRDAEVVDVLTLWEGKRDVPLATSLTRLMVDEAVPYLAAYRLKDTGLRKRAVWEETWDLQRREDAGKKVGPIEVPPKYTSADFRKTTWWQARGKLDVPKERFILYPAAGRSTDPTVLLGWAGWDHAQQSLALSIIINQREAEGWEDQRLVPLVAGLAELQPWVEQWHAEVDPTYGMSMAAFCRQQLEDRRLQVGKTVDELHAWRPEVSRRGRAGKRH